MDDLRDLLAQRQPTEPPEIAAIKSYVSERYQIVPQIMVRERDIVIGVPSAALAGALRPHLLELGAVCNTSKRLIIRIQG